MSPDTHGLTWAELDRLADYTADALGPADASRVANLVDTDLRWAAALRALREADIAVRADLSAAATMVAPVPDDVAAQIDAALRRLRPTGATVISLDAARAKRRRMATAGIAAAAATVVAVVGGISLNAGLIRSESNPAAVAPMDGTAGRDAPTAPMPDPATGNAGPGSASNAKVLASGTDYRLDTLPQLAALTPPSVRTSDAQAETPQFTVELAPDGLARLTAPAGLGDCLRAVASRYPGVVVVLDYARFEGQPALMIVIRQDSTSKIVAVGPDCGISGTDEKAAVPA